MPHASAAPWVGVPVKSCDWCHNTIGRSEIPLVTCTECGCRWTSPAPTDEALVAAYGAWYRPESGRFLAIGDRILRRSRSMLARRIGRISPPGPVLDVGAGDGTLLDALKAAGRPATGLEMRSTREDVLETNIEDVDGSFSAVIFWHSLEHLRSPRSAIASAYRLLRTDGVVIIAVPNSGSFQARLFGAKWFALDLPRHLVHLTSEALIAGLEQEGLHVERVSSSRGGQILFGWLHGLVGLLPGKLDLYTSIRRQSARPRTTTTARTFMSLLAGAFLLAPAVFLAAAEILLRRGGTVYVEARRA
jgi:SAM-dependent methyltransferase